MHLTSGKMRAFLLVTSLVILLPQVLSQSTTGDNREICLQPPLEGPCQDQQDRWYYERVNQTCEMFSFGGCEGNDNNFLSFKECSRTCGRIQRVPKKCRLLPDEGFCFDLKKRYYFNLTTMTCEMFEYGGCLGNQNRFNNIDSCKDFCLPKKNIPSYCYKPKDVGNGPDSIQRYYYDIDRQDCKGFKYTGSGGNKNNFFTKDICLQTCKRGRRKRQAAKRSQ